MRIEIVSLNLITGYTFENYKLLKVVRMWHQTLKKIDQVSTPAKAASLWNADTNSLKLVNDGINLVYRFESNGIGRYLRITHPSIRSFDELSAAIDYQRFLGSHAVPVCKPILSSTHRYIEQILQKEMVFLAHATDEVPGTLMHFEYTNSEVYKSWGRTLATLHKVAHTYKPVSELSFKTWKDVWAETANSISKEDEALKREYLLIDSWFKQLPKELMDYGLTHGDHRTANILYDSKQVYIIDFDEPVYHWFMADIARPFLELSSTPFSDWQDKFEWFIAGYRSVFPVNEYLLQHINWFVRIKSLDIYLWCKNNWYEPDAPGGKPRDVWLEELRHMVLNPLFC